MRFLSLCCLTDLLVAIWQPRKWLGLCKTSLVTDCRWGVTVFMFVGEREESGRAGSARRGEKSYGVGTHIWKNYEAGLEPHCSCIYNGYVK